VKIVATKTGAASQQRIARGSTTGGRRYQLKRAQYYIPYVMSNDFETRFSRGLDDEELRVVGKNDDDLEDDEEEGDDDAALEDEEEEEESD